MCAAAAYRCHSTPRHCFGNSRWGASACVHRHTLAHVHAHVCTFTHSKVHAHVYTSTLTHIHTYIHTHMHTHICILLSCNAYARVHVHTHPYTHTKVQHVHRCTQTRTQVHTNTHTAAHIHMFTGATHTGAMPTHKYAHTQIRTGATPAGSSQFTASLQEAQERDARTAAHCVFPVGMLEQVHTGLPSRMVLEMHDRARAPQAAALTGGFGHQVRVLMPNANTYNRASTITSDINYLVILRVHSELQFEF